MDKEEQKAITPGEQEDENEQADAPKKSLKIRAYDWLYDHHVTVKMMDTIIVLLVILVVIIIIFGR